MVEYGTENVSFCGSIAAWMARVPVRIYNHWGARYVGYEKGFARSFSIFIEKTCARLSTVVRQSSELNRQMCVADGIYKAEKVKVLGFGGTVGADFGRFDISKKAWPYCCVCQRKFLWLSRIYSVVGLHAPGLRHMRESVAVVRVTRW